MAQILCKNIRVCLWKAQNMSKRFGSVLLRSSNRSLEMHLQFGTNDFLMGHLVEAFGGMHALKSTITWRQCT